MAVFVKTDQNPVNSTRYRMRDLHGLARRATWDRLPESMRNRIKVRVASVAGVLGRHRPHVEAFGPAHTRAERENLKQQLERIDVSRATELCGIMARYGSDKRAGRHNYTTVYFPLFSPLRSTQLNIFELGIGTNNPKLLSTMGLSGKPGASLRGWSEFFPDASVFGADIDEAILFQEGRIQTFYCDQLNASIIQTMWQRPVLPKELDIIIEDGLHTFEANVSFLENSLHKVRRGGYYVIEDVSVADLPKWRSRLQDEYTRKYPDFSFYIVALPWLFNHSDNVLVVGRRHD